MATVSNKADLGFQVDRHIPSIAGASAPSNKGVPVVSGVAFPICNYLNVGTAGTATITYPDNSQVTETLVQGYNPIRCKAVTLISAANIVAHY